MLALPRLGPQERVSGGSSSPQSGLFCRRLRVA